MTLDLLLVVIVLFAVLGTDLCAVYGYQAGIHQFLVL
jgi:hypothetical protein